MGEDQSGDPAPAGFLGDVERRHVAADSAGEADRPGPARGIGEHEVSSGGPAGKRPELWCPDSRHSRQTQQITPGRVAGVRHGMRLNGQVINAQRRDDRLQPALAGQRSQLTTQFAALVADKPGGHRAVRFGTRAAVQHDLATPITGQQPGRRVARGVHCASADQSEAQPV
jgi:hypothetical protein